MSLVPASDGFWIARLTTVERRKLHFGPARVPSRESPQAALEALLEAGFSACEIDFEGGFWMDYDFASSFGALAAERDIALSVHAPLAGFMGHSERGRKLNMAVGMLDHSAGIAKAAAAELVVFHPGFLLGRTREQAIDSVCEQLAELRERLAAKERDAPFGIEVMGRVRELGSVEDVVEIASRLPWVRPVIDFAHMHATSDGGFTSVEPFAAALALVDSVLPSGAPFHIHFSDIQFANRNETKHLPYGAGTLRAEPLAEALARSRSTRHRHLGVAGRAFHPGGGSASSKRLRPAERPTRVGPRARRRGRATAQLERRREARQPVPFEPANRSHRRVASRRAPPATYDRS